jgi:hypothetical protein
VTITHHAWAGPDWPPSPPRLLLLGDSHYLTDPDDDSAELTRDIVRDVRDGRRKIPFYSKAEALCRECLTTASSSTTSFWNQVAFVNFIPVTIGTVSSAVPSAEMWQAGAPRFIRLLEELRPTHVLSLGQRQWDHIRFPPDWRSMTAPEDDDVRLWLMPTGDRIRATWVNHPSSRGFSTTKWKPRIEALLRN